LCLYNAHKYVSISISLYEYAYIYIYAHKYNRYTYMHACVCKCIYTNTYIKHIRPRCLTIGEEHSWNCSLLIACVFRCSLHIQPYSLLAVFLYSRAIEKKPSSYNITPLTWEMGGTFFPHYLHRKKNYILKFYNTWFLAYGSENWAKWNSFMSNL
jgi:hypothetical protein